MRDQITQLRSERALAINKFGPNSLQAMALNEAISGLTLLSVLEGGFIRPTGYAIGGPVHPDYAALIDHVYEECNVHEDADVSVMASVYDDQFARVTIRYPNGVATAIFRNEADFSYEGDRWVDGSTWHKLLWSGVR